MQFVKRLIRCIPLLLFANAVWLFYTAGAAGGFLLPPAAAFALMLQIRPCPSSAAANRRLRILHGGCELLYLFAFCFLLQCGILVHTFSPKAVMFWLNALFSLSALFMILLNGLLRIFLCSAQAGILWRVLLLLFWWFPGLNLYLKIGRAHV